MADAIQKIDLHVHSKYAGRFKPFVLNSLAVEESYTEPEALYQTLLARGMTMVTITDHDAITGCLEIAHHGDHVFVSEEISARFPENGCIVHVLAYGITEAQHEEIQRLRYNIYELVPYLRAQDILHALAHPFSPVNQRLSVDLLRKSFLLFDTIELINGQKDPGHERFVREVLSKVDMPLLEEWSNRYDIDIPPNRSWKVVGGSDDHSGVTAARSSTSFRGPATLQGLTRAVKQGEVSVSGFEKTGTSYSHTAYIGTINYFRHSNRQGSKQTYSQLIELVTGGRLPASLESLPPVLQRLVPAAMETLAEAGEWPNATRLAAEGHQAEIHDEIYDLVQKGLLRAFRSSFSELQRSVETIDLEPIIDEIPTLIRLTLFNLPYYFGFRFYYGERRRARLLYEQLELSEPLGHTPKVAVFCDTLDNVDGVSIGLRRIVRELRDANHDVFLCGASPDGVETSNDGPEVVRFPTIGSFPLLGYESYNLGWPSLLEVLRWVDENEIDLLVATTPGPVGLVAMMASRLLGTPIIGQYHTNIPEYASRIIGDRTIAQMVRAYTAWFYNNMNRVAVPTHAAGEVVVGNGIRAESVQVVRRGVDVDAFHPSHRSETFWRNYGLKGRNTLLYVGRVSVEKNLPFLVDVFRSAVESGIDVELGVVGDGPYLEKMKEATKGLPVAFTGYLRGQQLARAFASSDLLVFPSTTDTFGNVVLEALASGTPALVSDVGGPCEIVHHLETGCILPAGDGSRWQQTIRDMITKREFLEKLSRQSRTYAETCTFERARAEQWEFYASTIRAFHRQLQGEPA